MKPPRREESDPTAFACGIEELSAALRTGTLVELLTSKGLSESTVGELLRPESAAALRAILSRPPLPREEARDPSPGCRPRHRGRKRGKLLVFKPREAIRR